MSTGNRGENDPLAAPEEAGDGARDLAATFLAMRRLRARHAAEIAALHDARAVLVARYDDAVARRDGEVGRRDTEIARRDTEIARQATEIARRDEAIARLGAEIAERDAEITRRDAEIVRRDAGISGRDADIARLIDRSTALEAALRTVHGSIAWRLTGPLRGIVARHPTLARYVRAIAGRHPDPSRPLARTVRGVWRLLTLRNFTPPAPEVAAPDRRTPSGAGTQGGASERESPRDIEAPATSASQPPGARPPHRLAPQPDAATPVSADPPTPVQATRPETPFGEVAAEPISADPATSAGATPGPTPSEPVPVDAASSCEPPPGQARSGMPPADALPPVDPPSPCESPPREAPSDPPPADALPPRETQRHPTPPPAAGAARQDTAGDGAATVWFHLGDTIEWVRDFGHLTGVGRVTLALFRASRDGVERGRIRACALGDTESGLVEIDPDGVFSAGPGSCAVGQAGETGDPERAGFAAGRAVPTSVPPATDAATSDIAPPGRAGAGVARLPVAGDHVLFTGAVWTETYDALMRSLVRREIDFSVLVYDVIPLEHPEFVTGEHHRLFAAWLETALRLAHVVFVPGAGVADQLRRWAALASIPVAASIVPIVFGGGPLPAVATAATPSRAGPGPFVLSVGTIDRRKNQALLCRLWQRLLAEFDPSAVPRLVLAGRDDARLADRDESLAALIRAGKLAVLRDVADAELAAFYRDCLLTAFPSLSEGHGLPVGESFAYGKLCVASDLACIRDHAGSLAWYFDPADEAAAYAVLKRAIFDPAARQAAEARIRETYRPEAWSSTWRSMARTIAGSRGAPPSSATAAAAFAVPGVVPAAIPAALTRARTWCGADAPEVSILIVNWNASHLTAECVRQIWANTTGIRYEIVIVDNGSVAAHLDPCRHLGAGVRLIALGVNRYFGEANNIAAEHAGGRLLCLLNNDAFVREGWLGHLTRCLDGDPGAGAAGPLLLFPDGTIQEAGAAIDAGGYPVRFQRGLDPAAPGTDLTPKPVDYVSAAALLIRRDAFFAAGGFDLAYEPAYYEDVDLCFRLRAAGLRVLFCPDAKVVHIEGGSSNGDAAAERRRASWGDINRDKFTARWGDYLRGRSEATLRAIAGRTRPRIAAPSRRAEPRPTAALFSPYALTPGGGERFLLTAAQALGIDHAVTIVTAHPYSRLRLIGLGREFGLDMSGCALLEADAFLAGPDPDVFLVMGNQILPPMPARAANSVYVCQFPFFHRIEEVREELPFIGQYRRVIAYSEFARAHVFAALNAYQMPRWPIEVVHPPVPPQAGGADRKRAIILSVGRFFSGGHNKRHDAMIAAFRALRERFDAGAELHFAGSSLPDDVEYLNGLRALAAGLPVVFHVNATPETLAGLYRDAAVYWHAAGFGGDLVREPGLAEHFGISVAEAMSAGCVAMAFNAGGPREIITHGVDGFLYGSLDELVAATHAMMRPEAVATREAIGRAGARRAAAFSTDAFTSRLRRAVLGPGAGSTSDSNLASLADPGAAC